MANDEHDSSRLHIVGRIIGIAIVISAMVATIYAIRLNYARPRTDDAAVRANVVGIAPHVSGPIVDMRVVGTLKRAEIFIVPTNQARRRRKPLEVPGS